MKKNIFIIVIIFPILFLQCNYNKKRIDDTGESISSYQLPKVLFISSGTEEGNGKLAQGIIIAIQSFNRKGAIVKIESRDILKYPDKLKNYNFLILSTALGYHDADRLYSLSFMSDFEIENVRNFVKDGGVLIAGDNVGRNKLDGIDRISLYGRLTPANWGLSDCFGLTMQEINMKEFRITGDLDSNLNGQFKDISTSDLWILVGDSIHSPNLKELAKWEDGKSKYPAIIKNEYGKGISFLLPSSYFLHPSNDGGYWSASQIQTFYDLTLEAFNKKHNNKLSINPWPNGHDHAFCVSLNTFGTLNEYKRLDMYLEQEMIDATFFVNGKIKTDIQNYLSNKTIQSNGYAKIEFNKNLYPASKDDIKENEIHWNKNFKGFRFPYTRNSFWGLMALDELGYKYESSIGADNVERYLGCVFPYQIPISYNGYYRTTNILEISPTFHDDYFFFGNVLTAKTYNETQQEKDARLFEKYLLNYWEYAVKPYNGLMVFMGHPGYVGHSDNTLSALKTLVTKVKNDDTWITTLDEVADYWEKLNSMHFDVVEDEKNIQITIRSSGNSTIKKLTLNVGQRPENVKVKLGHVEVKQRQELYQIIFDAQSGQQIDFSY